jgi:hypothetical protein
LGLLTTINLEVLFCSYALFPVLLLFFKCILEFVFCDGVQLRLRFCLDYASCAKMVAFQFYLRSEKQRKVAGDQARLVGWVGNYNHVVFGKIIPDEKGNQQGLEWFNVDLQE